LSVLVLRRAGSEAIASIGIEMRKSTANHPQKYVEDTTDLSMMMQPVCPSLMMPVLKFLSTSQRKI
jgi:hypothetical protein